MRSVVVRIVLAMTLAFKLSIDVSIGRDKSAQSGRSFRMSDKARQLAAEVNKRQADQHIKNQLQLHKAEILRAKGFNFWNKLAIAVWETVQTVSFEKLSS